MIVTVMELSGILHLSTDDRFAKVAIIANNSKRRGRKYASGMVYLSQIITVKDCACSPNRKYRE